MQLYYNICRPGKNDGKSKSNKGKSKPDMSAFAEMFGRRGKEDDKKKKKKKKGDESEVRFSYEDHEFW